MTTPLLQEDDTDLLWKQQDKARADMLSKQRVQDTISPAASNLSYQPYYDTTNLIRQDSFNANANAVQVDAQQKQRESALAAQKMAAAQSAMWGNAQSEANSWATGYSGNGAGWGGGGAQGVANVLREAGFPEEAIPTMMAIAKAESGWRPEAINTANRNGSVDRGLFQINSIHQGNSWYPQNPFDPLQNAKAAFAVYQGQGLNAWSVYKSGKYKEFLQPAPPRQTYAANTGGSTGVRFATANNGSSFRQQVINKTMMEIGTPYVWGGNSLVTGVDCSGLVQQIYREMGISLPRTAQEQFEYGKSGVHGTQTSLANLSPGDLVAWKGGYDRGRYIGHIAIYAGGGQIIEAPTPGVPVRRRSLYNTENAFGIHLYLPGD